MSQAEVLLDEILLLEIIEQEECERCGSHPAFLIDRMFAVDERTADVFHFDVLTPEERAEANATLIEVYGPDEDLWPAHLGWRSKPGRWFWQRSVLDEWMACNRWVGLKARQLGITWDACGMAGWTALYKPGSLSLLYRQKEEEAHENNKRCWELVASLPEHLWNGATLEKPSRVPEPIATEELRFRFPDGKASRVLAMTSASASGHGKTASLVVLDEYSRIDRASEIMKAVNSAAGKTGKILIISTANGVSNPETGEGNRFHFVWVNSEAHGYTRRFLPWSLHPDRDQDWYDNDSEVRGLMAHERAEQYPANEDEAFALTTNNFFDPECLSWYANLVPPVVERFQFKRATFKDAKRDVRSDGMIRLYRKPDPDHKYAIGVDVASGTGLDFSAACVIDLSNLEVCAELYARLDPDLLAFQLHYLGRWFNTALIAPESSGGYGAAVIIPLRDGREGRPAYPRLYKHRQFLRADQNEHDQYGFPTSRSTRPQMLNQVERHIRERTLPYMPRVLMDEAKTFLRGPLPGRPAHGTWPRAQEGTHDDMIFATAIALEMYRQYGEWPDRQKPKAKRGTLLGLGR